MAERRVEVLPPRAGYTAQPNRSRAKVLRRSPLKDAHTLGHEIHQRLLKPSFRHTTARQTRPHTSQQAHASLATRSRNEAFSPTSITYKSEPAMRTDRTRSGATRASSRLSRDRTGDRTVRGPPRAPHGVGRGGHRGGGRTYRPTRRVRASEGWASRCAGLGRAARSRSRMGLCQRRTVGRRAPREWTARAAALRRRAGARGVGGGRGGRPVKAWRSAAAPAWTASR